MTLLGCFAYAVLYDFAYTAYNLCLVLPIIYPIIAYSCLILCLSLAASLAALFCTNFITGLCCDTLITGCVLTGLLLHS